CGDVVPGRSGPQGVAAGAEAALQVERRDATVRAGDEGGVAGDDRGRLVGCAGAVGAGPGLPQRGDVRPGERMLERVEAAVRGRLDEVRRVMRVVGRLRVDGSGADAGQREQTRDDRPTTCAPPHDVLPCVRPERSTERYVAGGTSVCPAQTASWPTDSAIGSS